MFYIQARSPSSSDKKANAPVSEWALIVQYNMNNTAEYERKKKELQEANKRLLKETLDKQKHDSASNPEKVKAEIEADLKRAMDDVQAYHEEERKKKEARHKVTMEELSIQQQQVLCCVNRVAWPFFYYYYFVSINEYKLYKLIITQRAR